MVVIQLQVFNLTEVKPHESLETFAAKGDESARECRELIQIMLLKSDAKLANKVLIAKKKSIEEGAERFRRDLLQNLSNNLVSSTVRGVMSDDVVRFFNLLTTTQFWATMAYLSREYWKRRCWAITKSMENEIVVEAFMNFRTHTR
ncbi:unnamed protein product [Brassica napus]|uniref:(rape) hypothetical protein n=1 Tax=Brassica napus TaxID=3708 RepID=A0A816SPQ2_BRANA|nr:unnamed protein product [Brassica napus]